MSVYSCLFPQLEYANICYMYLYLACILYIVCNKLEQN